MFRYVKIKMLSFLSFCLKGGESMVEFLLNIVAGIIIIMLANG